MNVSEAIERISREDNRFPLSFAQKRLWLQQQIDPASTAYNMMFANDIRGPFEPEAFEQAIHLLVQRQEALQIQIDAEAGIPYQCIEHDKPDYQFVDVSMHSNAQPEQHIAELIEIGKSQLIRHLTDRSRKLNPLKSEFFTFK